VMQHRQENLDGSMLTMHRDTSNTLHPGRESMYLTAEVILLCKREEPPVEVYPPEWLHGPYCLVFNAQTVGLPG
jgi:hypothetical protein